MKPSPKQLKVIEFLEQQLGFWKNSNDIRSPTHLGDINAFLQLHTDIFTEHELEYIDSIASELYFNIMRIK